MKYYVDQYTGEAFAEGTTYSFQCEDDLLDWADSNGWRIEEVE